MTDIIVKAAESVISQIIKGAKAIETSAESEEILIT